MLERSPIGETVTYFRGDTSHEEVIALARESVGAEEVRVEAFNIAPTSHVQPKPAQRVRPEPRPRDTSEEDFLVEEMISNRGDLVARAMRVWNYAMMVALPVAGAVAIGLATSIFYTSVAVLAPVVVVSAALGFAAYQFCYKPLHIRALRKRYQGRGYEV